MIKPVIGLQPEVNQIYPIVNEVFNQMTGRTDLQAVDTASLIAMGNELTNLGKADLWLNTLCRRIGLTIDSYRAYRNKFASLYRNSMEWGALVQKLTVEMPEAVMDDIYDVGKMDGKSVDQYIINNPKVHQKIFDKETPYSFFITIQKKLLKEAFLNEGQMASLINQIFGKIQNKSEFVLEELARMAVVNFILNLSDKQEFHLCSMYNSTVSPSKAVTTQSARYDSDFLRYAIGIINNVSKKMETMSVLYNSEKYDRFTPVESQHLYMLADFMTILETVVSYAAFNPQYVTARPDILVPYWQASKSAKDLTDWNTLSGIAGSVKAKEVKKNNLIAVLFDHDAIGTFRIEEDVLTTPVNARAAYYNTFWHERQMWFNDMSENGVAFYLD